MLVDPVTCAKVYQRPAALKKYSIVAVDLADITNPGPNRCAFQKPRLERVVQPAEACCSARASGVSRHCRSHRA